MNRTKFVVVCGMLAVLLGCSDEETRCADHKEPYCSYPSPIARTIQPTNVVAYVNGAGVTRAQYDAEYQLRAITYALSRKLSPAKREAKVKMYLSGLKEPLLLDLARRELLRQACDARSVSVPQKDIAVARRKFMKDIHSPGGSFDDFTEKLPAGLRTALVDNITEDVRNMNLLRAWSTNDLASVDAQEVSNRLSRLERLQEDVDRRNAEAKRKAAAAKAEILAGASFYSVTTNRAEIFQDQGREWDTVELGELDTDSDLFHFLASAKAGDISDPLDLDDGIGIVGVVAKELGEALDGVPPAMQYELVRCMFNAYDMPDEPQDFAAMRKLLIDRKCAAGKEALVRELAEKAKIEFPYGESLFSMQKKSEVKKRKAQKGHGKAKRAGKRKEKSK